MKDLLVGIFILGIASGVFAIGFYFPILFFGFFILFGCWAIGRAWRVWGEMTKRGMFKC